MADRVDITVHEGNDETVEVTVTGPGLDDVEGLEFVLKHSTCDADDDDTVLLLTTADPGEMAITAQTDDEITAEAYLPGTALADPFPRVYRVDAIGAGGDRRTALYGTVTVVDL